MREKLPASVRVSDICLPDAGGVFLPDVGHSFVTCDGSETALVGGDEDDKKFEGAV